MRGSNFAIIAVLFLLGITGIVAHLVGATSAEMAAWVQAVGSIVAVFAAFMVADSQLRDRVRQDTDNHRGVAHAAHLLAHRALELVADRLAAALELNSKKFRYRLRGSRTTEMILAMREFETRQLPPKLLSDFVMLRSQIYAINERISEVYETENKGQISRRQQRATRLEGARIVYREAEEVFKRFDQIARQDFEAPDLAALPQI